MYWLRYSGSQKAERYKPRHAGTEVAVIVLHDEALRSPQRFHWHDHRSGAHLPRIWVWSFSFAEPCGFVSRDDRGEKVRVVVGHPTVGVHAPQRDDFFKAEFWKAEFF